MQDESKAGLLHFTDWENYTIRVHVMENGWKLYFTKPCPLPSSNHIFFSAFTYSNYTQISLYVWVKGIYIYVIIKHDRKQSITLALHDSILPPLDNTRMDSLPHPFLNTHAQLLPSQEIKEVSHYVRQDQIVCTLHVYTMRMIIPILYMKQNECNVAFQNQTYKTKSQLQDRT